jgi:uncharacterized YigZ family protein
VHLSTPRTPARCELRVRDSRFLATVVPIASEDDARRERAVLEQNFPDATHHCWAFRLHAPRGGRERHDDAGEPAGTAGLPILQAIRGAEVINVLVVVARWFGGTKLGKGGLARAYRDAARAALAQAGVVRIVPAQRVRLRGGSALDGEVRHLVARCGGHVEEASYDESGVATLTTDLPEAAVDRLREELAHLSRGTWAVEIDR